jgi:hypothetical protein
MLQISILPSGEINYGVQFPEDQVLYDVLINPKTGILKCYVDTAERCFYIQDHISRILYKIPKSHVGKFQHYYKWALYESKKTSIYSSNGCGFYDRIKSSI